MNYAPLREGEILYAINDIVRNDMLLMHKGDTIKIMEVIPDEGIVSYERKGEAGNYVYEVTNLSTFHDRFKRPFEI